MHEAFQTDPDDDRCSKCHKAFPDFSMIYPIAEGSKVAIGQCCIDMIEHRVRFGGILYRRDPLTESDPAPWEFADLSWSLLHPGRSHRVRLAYEMEYPELSIVAEDKVIVRHIEKETYIKVLLNWEFSKNICDDEGYLQLIFHIACNFKNDDNLICKDIRAYKISI